MIHYDASSLSNADLTLHAIGCHAMSLGNAEGRKGHVCCEKQPSHVLPVLLIPATCLAAAGGCLFFLLFPFPPSPNLTGEMDSCWR